MSNIHVGRIVIGMVQTNCYFLYEEGKTDVICVDPADRGQYIYDKLKEKGFSVAAIILTHGHFDHIMGVQQLKELTGCKVYAYESEKVICESEENNVSASVRRSCKVICDEYLRDEQEVTIAEMTFRLIATPGHTIGSCCYYFEEDKILISGDTLFQESVGRTDLPTGSMGALSRSIKERLMVLPGDVTVYPGHGDTTTIAHEIRYNPFCS